MDKNNAAAPVGSAGESLIELLYSLRPNYGDIGSRDVDVTAARTKIEAAIALLSARAAPGVPAPHEKSAKYTAELLAELRRWAGEDTGYASKMMRSAANEIERLLGVPAPVASNEPMPEPVSLRARPLLYTETVNDQQVCRDDLWIVTTHVVNRAAASELAAPAAPTDRDSPSDTVRHWMGENDVVLSMQAYRTLVAIVTTGSPAPFAVPLPADQSEALTEHLTDEQCSQIRQLAAINADLWAESHESEPTQAEVDSVFVHAIIRAADSMLAAAPATPPAAPEVQEDRIAAFESEISRLKQARFILAQTMHNIMVGNQSAWIEWRRGKGAEVAMEWIENGLIGPGLIPDGKEAQAFFDANVDDRMQPDDPKPVGWPAAPTQTGESGASD